MHDSLVLLKLFKFFSSSSNQAFTTSQIKHLNPYWIDSRNRFKCFDVRVLNECQKTDSKFEYYLILFGTEKLITSYTLRQNGCLNAGDHCPKTWKYPEEKL